MAFTIEIKSIKYYLFFNVFYTFFLGLLMSVKLYDGKQLR